MILGALGGSIRYGVDRSITWKNKWGEYAYKPLLGCDSGRGRKYKVAVVDEAEKAKTIKIVRGDTNTS